MIKYYWLIAMMAMSVFESADAAMTLRQQEFEERTREYYVYAPPSENPDEKRPLVLVFHGGNGDAKRIAQHTRFNDLADKEGFIVVYPEAVEKYWNDGRNSEHLAGHSGVDDVAWIKSLLKVLKDDYPVDDQRVYAAGISNGGMFTQRLAIELTQPFAAVASVTAQIPKPLIGLEPLHPISVLLINGTDDPFVPYEGGEVTPYLFPQLAEWLKKPKRGEVISTADTVDFWLWHNDIRNQGDLMQLPDRNQKDGTTVEKLQWTHDITGVSVVLYRIVGGGHTWPGAKPYLAEALIGRTSQELDATEAIWHFFSKHSRANNVPIMFADRRFGRQNLP